MSLTDDDLKRLKDGADGKPDSLYGFDRTLQDIKALIARLEAAEEAMKAAYSAPAAMMQGHGLYDKWRKACGRE